MSAHRIILPQFRRPFGVRRAGGISGLVRRDDQGFTLVEILVAMGVFSLVAIFTLASLAAGLNGVLLAKRREVATQEANRILEIARSLSYNDVGLVQSPGDPTINTDSAIQLQGGALSYSVSGDWEPIIWATNAAGHPYNPHKSSLSRGSTALTRYVYVTGLDTSGDGVSDVKRVTVRVTWRSESTAGPNEEVRGQTMINESGVLATGPGPGGTVAGSTPLTGKTFSTGGSLSVNSSLLGLSAPLHVNLPTSDGSSTFRAVSNTSCTTKSANLEVLDQVDQDGYSVSVTADDDSRTPTPSNPSPQSSSGVLAVPGGPVADLLGSTINSAIACEANVDPLGHELGTGSSLGLLNAQDNVVALGGLLNWLLTVASVNTLPVSQSIDHGIVGDQREVHASSTSAAGLVNILKIPGLITDGLVRIDGIAYGASVRGAEGTPSAGPTVTAPTINMRIYDNGNKLPNGTVCRSHSGGYCIVSVNPSAAGFSGLFIDVTHNFTQVLGLNVVNLSYTTSVDILPPTKSPTAGVVGPNGERRWTAEYTPMAVSASLKASVLGVDIIDAEVDLNLGTVRAEACAGATC